MRRGHDERREAVQRRLALLRDDFAVLDDHDEASPGRPSHTRIRPAPGSPPGEANAHSESRSPQGGPDTDAGPLVVVPVPGRHAARRLRRWPLADLVSVGPAPAHVAVVAMAVVVGLAGTCWWLLRSGPEELPAAPAPVPALVTPDPGGGGWEATTGAGQAGAAPEPEELVIDVAGRVRRPGIVVLRPGSRVVDALDAAGGVRPGVDLASLNLARPLVDGEQIVVGIAAGRAPAVQLGQTGAAVTGPLVNLNTAGPAELEALPEVGPVTAAAILAWRDEHGSFSSVDQLLDVDGIGEATLHTLTPLVTV